MQLMPTIIFDLDNTLIECKQYYDEAIEEFAARKSGHTGLSEEFCRTLLNQLDLHSCHLPGGFSADRFPRSFKAASLALDVIANCEPDVVLAESMYGVGEAVFAAPYTLYPGVETTLQQYVRGGWQLVLCSKGEDSIQWSKIRKHGLQAYFPTERVYITLQKSRELLLQIVKECNADPERTWVVGDSIRDDIGPAKAADLGAVEVVNREGTWAYESEAHEPHARIEGVPDLTIVIPYDAQHSSAFTAELRRKVVPAVT